MDRRAGPELPDGPGFWLALAGVFAALGVGGITIAITEYHPPWTSAWFIVGAVVSALGCVCAIWSLVLYLAHKQATSHTNLERRERARELERAGGGHGKGLLKAGQITDRALLGIHPSIPLPPDADPSLSPDLPLYIPRDIDGDMRGWIAAHQDSGGFLLLVGPAASGKTRCAYELTHDRLADWPMFMPGTPAQLTEYFETDPTPSKLVIWLNETQKFVGPNGLTSATVRRILARPQPTVIIGTIWPDDYDTLTSQPLSDAQRDTREILTMIAQRKDLLSGFSRSELDRAHSLADRDPRIAQAISQTEGVNLPEILAAAPDLISRWLNAADPYGASVITAAVIARRCGHPEPLPAAVLESLSLTVLTPSERGRAAPCWFPAALQWARAPVRGPAAPLTPQATTPGVIEGDQISDVLVQHAARHFDVPGHTTAESIWKLLIDKAEPPACWAIANAAYWLRGYRDAVMEHALRKAAADAKNIKAMSLLATVLDLQGKAGEAEQWSRKAAAAGDTEAMSKLASLLIGRSKEDEAEQWYRKAAEAGNPYAMFKLASLLSKQGREDEADRWNHQAELSFRKAAAAGDMLAMAALTELLMIQGKPDEAEQWIRKSEQFVRKLADSGTPLMVLTLGALLLVKGKEDEAEQWFRKAANAGETGAMVFLGRMLVKRGEEGEAEHWYRKAADAGHLDAMSRLAGLLRKHGKAREAEQWYLKESSARRPNE